VGLVSAALVLGALAPVAGAAPQEQQKLGYTAPEYNAYQAAVSEKDPQRRVKLLDDLVAKLPADSGLLPYIYQNYFDTYNQLKNYPKVLEYADRLLALGDKIQLQAQLQFMSIRCQAFELSYNQKDPNAKQQAARSREVGLQALKLLDKLPKAETVTDAQFAEQKKPAIAFFNNSAGFASLQLKDFKSAVDSFKAALAASPNDAVTYFRMGVAYLQMEPPQSMDGFWALARSIALKGPGEAQVRTYLRNQLLRYQQTGCDKLLDAQMSELLTLAASSAERPAAYKIPSAADLESARKQAESENFIAVLKAGADKAKLLWLATCGLEFPEVGGKVIEVSADNSVVLKLFIGATSEETEAGTTANMEVKLEGQPEAKRIQSGDAVRFAATLAGYDPDPFMLHWDKAKVNPEDIPPEKGQPAKRPAKRPAKKAGR
jgi:tetratricopeptide (TPR) repeat protein